MAKFTVSEYLKRLTSNIWTRTYELVLMCIRIFLFVTFFAVVIATLAECQPFNHYWQVTPDPGPRCRSGYAQLLVMSTCDIITDILLVVFPIPIIVHSAMPLNRKFTVSFLFSLSVILIVITAYRLPAIIHHNGRQQLRSLWASLEILAAAAVSNALILGSFVRDRGVKKAKYKGPEVGTTERTGSETIDEHSHIVRSMTRRHWGNDSDEDLFANCRGRLDTSMDHSRLVPAPVIAKPALPSSAGYPTFSNVAPNRNRNDSGGSQGLGRDSVSPTFFDVGGILSDDHKDSMSVPGSSHADSMAPLSPSTERPPPRSAPPMGPMAGPKAFDFADVGGLLGEKTPVDLPPDETSTSVVDYSSTDEESSRRAGKRRKASFSLGLSTNRSRDTTPAPTSAPRRMSLSKEPSGMDLQDIGGILSQPIIESPRLDQHESTEMQMADAGGLLGSASTPKDERIPREVKAARHVSGQSSHSASSARKSRSRSSSMRNSLRPAPDSHHKNKAHSRSRSRDVGLRAPPGGLEKIPSVDAATGDASIQPLTPEQVAALENDVPAPTPPVPTPPIPEPKSRDHTPHPLDRERDHDDASVAHSERSIDTRAHARDWLAKIKEARNRQNENHGMTSRQAAARGGEDLGMELEDIGGLLEATGEDTRVKKL